ncbi:hypothetical protein GCM10027403_12970 [Arthrobacter tecti]
MAYQSNPAFEYFSKPDRVTCEAAAAVVGKTFVKLAPGGADQAPKVVTCGAGERPYGVAGWDVPAGKKVIVHRIGIISVTAGANLAGAAAVAVGAEGKAVPVAAAPAVAYGDAHADTTAGDDAAIALSL